MRRRLLLHGLLILLSALVAQAQQTVELGPGTADLTGPWKFHPGDSPSLNGSFAWAQPDLDDSSWDSMDLRPPAGSIDPQMGGAAFIPGWTDRGYPDLRRFAWYRLRVHVRAADQPLWISMPLNVDDAYQVYANGRYLGEFGSFTAHGVLPSYTRPVIFPLPPAPAGDVEIAIRFFMMDYSPLRWPQAGGMHAPPILGLRSAIFTLRSSQSSQSLKSRLGDCLVALLNLLALPIVVWLALTIRREPVWFWLACAVGAESLGTLANTSALLGPGVPMWVGELVVLGLLSSVINLCWILFWLSWFGLPAKRWIGVTACILTAANIVCNETLMSPSAGLTLASQSVLRASSIASEVFTVAIDVLLLAVLVLGYRRARTAAFLATLPLLMQVLSSLYVPLLVIFRLPSAVYFHGLGMDNTQLASIFMLLSVGILVLRRFLAGRDQEAARKAGIERDLEEARLMQQAVLTPGSFHLAGVHLHAVYHPAQQVGGDFFHAQTCADGAVLIAIGDVSGKGLPAAMTVALLIGALRIAANASSRPAELLRALNSALQAGKRTGFTTCLVLRLEPSGQLTLANAGHIAPYLDGRELSIENGLPLGLAEGATYSETTLALSPGERLTLLTDGVVEARNPTGELFGFERTAAVSKQSAEAIAGVAQQFGQEDDITVLTLTFAPAEVLHA